MFGWRKPLKFLPWIKSLSYPCWLRDSTPEAPSHSVVAFTPMWYHVYVIIHVKKTVRQTQNRSQMKNILQYMSSMVWRLLTYIAQCAHPECRTYTHVCHASTIMHTGVAIFTWYCDKKTKHVWNSSLILCIKM